MEWIDKNKRMPDNHAEFEDCANDLNMNSTALDRPYQAERTAEQTPRANGRGICQATLFIFIVVCLF